MSQKRWRLTLISYQDSFSNVSDLTKKGESKPQKQHEISFLKIDRDYE